MLYSDEERSVRLADNNTIAMHVKVDALPASANSEWISHGTLPLFRHL